MHISLSHYKCKMYYVAIVEKIQQSAFMSVAGITDRLVHSILNVVVNRRRVAELVVYLLQYTCATE